VPPASVLATPKLPVKVDASRTNGAVSQREADRWAAAFLREQAIEGWAITANEDGVLKGGCLGSLQAYDTLFAGEVSTVQQAKGAGGHLEYDPSATETAISIVPASAEARDYVTNLSGQTAHYAVVGTLRGPITAYIVGKSGERTEIGHTGSGVVFRRAAFGRYRNDLIGPIWFQFASDNCASAWMAGTCAS
jgi:hypothetical protein